jgi:aminoglycoside phosphotransferase (APT) family kinase protein
METSAVGTELSTTLSQLLDGAKIHDLHRLSGGASRETWRFTADGRPLILQRQRAGDQRNMLVEAGVVSAARRGGVPVPELIEARRRDDGMAFMVLEAIDGETIARKIQRDDEFADARLRLTADFGAALARIHALEPSQIDGLEHTDQLTYYTDALDSLGQPHPVLELVRNWLIDTQPTSERTCVVHGDFRLGNVIVGSDGLRAVIDWELAHLGDPMEDLGWLCVKAWRFGGRPPVAGLGEYETLFSAYEAAGGAPVDPVVVHWWEVLGTWKWAIMCILQASVHLNGATRSHELAAIGRRVCENEHDLLLALDGRW